MNRYIIIYLSLFLLIGCKSNAQDKTKEVTDLFQKNLDEAISNNELDFSGVSMTVIAPDLNINWSGASGYDSNDKDKVLSENQPFRIASITKTFVAAAILRLHEEGKLSINDPISKYVSKKHITILESDGYDLDKITVKQCLYHRSGLFDYALGSNAYVEEVIKDPKKRWSRTQQIQFAVDNGEPLGAPDTVFGYSDTGYVLLGETLETVTGKGLAEALRTLLHYKELGLSATWLDSLEERPDGLPKSVNRYMEGIDATNWDNSIDLYGGGGIASTTKDLAVFFNAMFNHKVFNKKETLSLMLEDPGPVKMTMGPEKYRMGLWQINVFGTHGYMHNGFWGSAWVYIPKMNSTIAVNYTNNYSNSVLQKTAKVLKEVIEKNKD